LLYANSTYPPTKSLVGTRKTTTREQAADKRRRINANADSKGIIVINEADFKIAS
ncbi:hypothetical protein T06_8672, partial [Trichinella sp. T6]